MTVNIAADGHQLAKIFDLESRGSTRQSGKEIQSEILERKKAVFRWNTLCISRKNNAFPAEKTSGVPAKAQRKRVWWGEAEQRSD